MHEFGGHIELPTQLADIGDAGGAHQREAELDDPAGGERERLRPTRRSGVSDCSNSRERGPITDSTPMPEVTLVRTQCAAGLDVPLAAS